VSRLLSVMVCRSHKETIFGMYGHEIKPKKWSGITQKFEAFLVQNIVVHEEVLVWLHTGFASALDGDECSA